MTAAHLIERDTVDAVLAGGGVGTGFHSATPLALPQNSPQIYPRNHPITCLILTFYTKLFKGSFFFLFGRPTVPGKVVTPLRFQVFKNSDIKCWQILSCTIFCGYVSESFSSFGICHGVVSAKKSGAEKEGNNFVKLNRLFVPLVLTVLCWILVTKCNPSATNEPEQRNHHHLFRFMFSNLWSWESCAAVDKILFLLPVSSRMKHFANDYDRAHLLVVLRSLGW